MMKSEKRKASKKQTQELITRKNVPSHNHKCYPVNESNRLQNTANNVSSRKKKGSVTRKLQSPKSERVAALLTEHIVPLQEKSNTLKGYVLKNCQLCSTYSISQKIVYRFLMDIRRDVSCCSSILELSREIIPYNIAGHGNIDDRICTSSAQKVTNGSFCVTPLYFPFHTGPSNFPILIVRRTPLYAGPSCPPSLLWSLPYLLWAGTALVGLSVQEAEPRTFTSNRTDDISSTELGNQERNLCSDHTTRCVFSDAFSSLSLTWSSTALVVKVQPLYPWLLLLCKASNNRLISRFPESTLPYIWSRWCHPPSELGGISEADTLARDCQQWYFLDPESETLEGVALLRGLPRIIVEAISFSFPGLQKSYSLSQNLHYKGNRRESTRITSCSEQTIHNHWTRLLLYIPDAYLFMIADSFGISSSTPDSPSSNVHDHFRNHIAHVLKEKFLIFKGGLNKSDAITDEEKRMQLVMSLWCAIRFIDHDVPSPIPAQSMYSLPSEGKHEQWCIDNHSVDGEEDEVPPYFVVPFFLLCRSFSDKKGSEALNHQAPCFSLHFGGPEGNLSDHLSETVMHGPKNKHSLSTCVQQCKENVESVIQGMTSMNESRQAMPRAVGNCFVSTDKVSFESCVNEPHLFSLL